MDYAVGEITYEIQGRPDDSTVWRPLGTTSSTIHSYSPLPAGDTWSFRVRARSLSGLVGEWVVVDNILLASDAVPPPTPSAPEMTSRLGIVRITWDGLTELGASLWPRDFAYVELAIGLSPAPTTIVEQFTGATGTVFDSFPTGETVYARLRAVDSSGNTSDWGADSSVTVVSLGESSLTTDGVSIVDELARIEGTIESSGVQTFAGTTFPLDDETNNLAIGDLFFNTDTQKAYRWDGTIWVEVSDGGDSAVLAALEDPDGIVQEIKAQADRAITTFYQDGEPLAADSELGDLWIDTNDGNKLYVYTAGGWVASDNELIQQAYDAAGNAINIANTALYAAAYQKNASFELWTAAMPTGFIAWNTGPTKETSTIRVGQYAARFDVTSASAAHGLSFGDTLAHMPNEAYVTVEFEFYLASGTLTGTSVNVDWTGLTPSRATLDLGTEVTNVQTERWYRVVKTLSRPAGATGTWTGMSGSVVANTASGGATKNLVVDWINVRPATQAEIDSLNSPALIDSKIDDVLNDPDGLIQGIKNQADAAITTYYGAQPAAGDLQIGDLWLDATDPANQILKRWDGSAWVRYDNPLAEAAYTAAGTAQDTADAKIRTFAQDAAPTGMTAADVGDLWIDTNDSNKMYRWSGSAWVTIQDGSIATAIAAAQAAQEAADGKITTFYGTTTPVGPNVGDLWLSGLASVPMKRWDGDSWEIYENPDLAVAYETAGDAFALADSKIRTFAADTAPTGLVAGDVGDLWIDTNDGNKLYRWSGSAWVPFELGISALADAVTARALGAITTYYSATQPSSGMIEGDFWIDTDDNKLYRYSGSAWVAIQDQAIQTALTNAATAQSTADGKIRTFAQATAPTGMLATDVGDLWIETDANNKLWRWDGDSWEPYTWGLTALDTSTITARALGGFTTYYQTTAPASGMLAGDFWIDTDDGNKLYRYSGSAWVAIQDAAIQAALDAAGEAQSIADSKIRTFAQDSEPAGLTAEDIGDLWLDTNDGNKLYRWSGSAWVVVQDTTISTAYQAAINALSASAYMLNASFDDWTGAAPVGFNTYTTNPTKNTTTKRIGSWSASWNITSTATQAGLAIGTALSHMPNTEYVTVEVEFMLLSGSITGAGVVLDWTGMTNNRVTIDFDQEIASPTLNKWYRIIKTVRRPTNATGTFTNMNGFVMANWTTFGAGIKNIAFDWFNVRPATSEEITSFGVPAQITDLTVSKIITYAQATAPTGMTPDNVGDLWIDTDNGEVWRYSGSAWVKVNDNGYAAAQAAEAAAVLAAAQAAQIKFDEVNARVNAAVDQIENKFTNPSFESDLEGWTTTGIGVSVVTSELHSGLKAAQFAANANPRTLLRELGAFPVAPGQIWRVGAWIKTTADYNGTSSWGKLRIGDGSDALLTALTWPNTAGVWSFESIDYTIPAGVTEIQVAFAADHTVGTMWLDDVVTKDISEITALYGELSDVQGDLTTLTDRVGAAESTAASNYASATRQHKYYVSAAVASGTANWGDIWQRFTAITGTSPNGVPATGATLVNWWRHDGTNWILQPNTELYMPFVNIGSGTFGTLSGARLTAGTVDADAVTTDFFAAERAYIRSRGENLITNGDGSMALAGAVPDNQTFNFSTWTVSSDVPTTAGAFHSFTSNTQTIRYTDEYVPLEGGGRYQLTVWAKANVTGSRFYVAINHSAGDTYFLSDQSLTTTWQKFEPKNASGDPIEIVIPNGVSSGRLKVWTNHSNGSVTNATQYFARWELRKKLDTGLIVDGGITAPKLDAGSVTAEKIALGSVGYGQLNIGTDELMPNPMWMSSTLRSVYPPGSGWQWTSYGPLMLGGQPVALETVEGTTADVTAYLTQNDIPVSPDERLFVATNVSNNADHQAVVVVWFYDVAGAWLNTTNAVTVDTGSIALGTELSNIITVPSGAATARVGVRSYAVATARVGHRTFNRVSIKRVMSSTSTSSQRVEISPFGIQMWGKNDEGAPSIDISASALSQITLRDVDDGTSVSLSKTGAVNARDITTNSLTILTGVPPNETYRDILEILAEYPRGLRARGYTGTTKTGISTEYGIVDVGPVWLDAGRTIELQCMLSWAWQTYPTELRTQLRYTYHATDPFSVASPSITSTLVAGGHRQFTPGSPKTSWDTVIFPEWQVSGLAAGYYRFLLTVWRGSSDGGTGTIYITSNAGGGKAGQIKVVDIGPAMVNTGGANDGGGTTPPVTAQYSKSFTSVNSGSWLSTGSAVTWEPYVTPTTPAQGRYGTQDYRGAYWFSTTELAAVRNAVSIDEVRIYLTNITTGDGSMYAYPRGTASSSGTAPALSGTAPSDNGPNFATGTAAWRYMTNDPLWKTTLQGVVLVADGSTTNYGRFNTTATLYIKYTK